MGGRGGSSGMTGGGNINAAPKIGDTVYIKEWFRNKIDMPSYAMKPYDATILEERGKAYKVLIETESLSGEHDLTYTRYVPKSVVETKAQRDAARKAEQQRYNEGVSRYNHMIEFAKANNVKGVRSGLRKETILQKIKNAGLSYEY